MISTRLQQNPNLDAALAFWGRGAGADSDIVVSAGGMRVLRAMMERYGFDMKTDPYLSRVRLPK